MGLEIFSAVPDSGFGASNCIRIGYAGMPQETIERFSQNLKDILDFFREQTNGKDLIPSSKREIPWRTKEHCKNMPENSKKRSWSS